MAQNILGTFGEDFTCILHSVTGSVALLDSCHQDEGKDETKPGFLFGLKWFEGQGRGQN